MRTEKETKRLGRANRAEHPPGKTKFPELVDIDTVARLLGVGERYVRRMIQERRVPIVKVGRLVRFDLAQIHEWIEEQRRPGRAS